MNITDSDIEERALEVFPVRKKLNKKGTGEYDANLSRRKAFIQGFKDSLSCGEFAVIKSVVTRNETTDRLFIDVKDIIPAPLFCEDGDIVKITVTTWKKNIGQRSQQPIQ